MGWGTLPNKWGAMYDKRSVLLQYNKTLKALKNRKEEVSGDGGGRMIINIKSLQHR